MCVYIWVNESSGKIKKLCLFCCVKKYPIYIYIYIYISCHAFSNFNGRKLS